MTPPRDLFFWVLVGAALRAHHWLLEAPSVYAPVLILIPFALRALREAGAPTGGEPECDSNRSTALPR